MLSRLESPDHVLAWKVSGTLLREDYDGLRDEIADALKKHPVVSVYADLTEFDDITLGAVVEDLKVEWSLIDRIYRFRRAAIVADKAWLSIVAVVWDTLFAYPTIKVFGSDEKDAAQQWVRERPRDALTQGSSIRQTVSRLPNVISFVVDGRMERKDVMQATDLLRTAFDKDGEIDLLVEIKCWKGFSPSVLADPSLWSLKLKAASQIRRYAIVTSKEWMHRGVELIDPLLKVEMRPFATNDLEAAWNWLAEGRQPVS